MWERILNLACVVGQVLPAFVEVVAMMEEAVVDVVGGFWGTWDPVVPRTVRDSTADVVVEVGEAKIGRA